MKKIDAGALVFELLVFSKQKAQLLNDLKTELKSAKKTRILFTPNPEQVVLASKNRAFKKYLQQADILIPDGVGLVYASKLLGFFGKAQALKERIPGVEVVEDLLRIAQEEKLKVMVIGGRGYDDLESGQTNISSKTEGQSVQIQWLEAYRDVAKIKKEEELELVKTIKKNKPDIVFVAFGAPFQEQWIIEHQELFNKIGVKLAMAVGGSFDFILGKVPRAPLLVRVLALEWLYRLIQEPWRWRRQLSLVEFIGLIFKELI